MDSTFSLVILLQGFLLPLIKAQVPGFVNLDCGGIRAHTDDIGLHWTPDTNYLFGQRANTSFTNGNKTQYKTVRYFPEDNAKYCYELNVTVRLRYLVRASFLYGNFDNTNVYPKFDIYLGATYWDTIVIDEPSEAVVTEMVVLAPFPYLSVCLSNATSGVRFISTIELRQFNGSMYYTNYEAQYFMFMAIRVNMGAHSNASLRYPDDPFDRIWESDSVQRPNFLYNPAPGTEKVSTTKQVFVNRGEAPPMKVMQTAVVGDKGLLTYTMNLKNFPGNAWAFTYMAEIEDTSPNDTRIFKVELPWGPPVNDALVNVVGNAGGKYRIYEPGFWNISLTFIASLRFRQTNDSSRGPILNAFEVFKYVLINFGALDATAMNSFVSNYPQAKWAREGGDPCLPTSWTWVQCNSDIKPRIISLKLSGRNLTGNIPQQLTSMSGMIELYLDGNSFSGAIPDFSALTNIEIIHLENNELTGPLPLTLANLPNLKKLFVQNNNLSGVIPKRFLRRSMVFNYSGNPNLQQPNEAKNNLTIILCVIGAVFLVALVALCIFCRYKKKQNKRGTKFGRSTTGERNLLSQLNSEPAHRIEFSEIEVATKNFEKLIGKGGFGSVYYGKLSDGSEIAVKVQNTESNQGIIEFINEVGTC